MRFTSYLYLVATLLLCVQASLAAASQIQLGPWEIHHPIPTDYARGLAHDGSKYVLVDGYGHIFTSISGRNWTRQPHSPLRPLHSIARGETNFVAVGDSGTILSSPDGTNWLTLNSPVTNNLAKIIFARGQFIAVGAEGTILTSTSGIDFTLHPRTTTTSFNDITAGPDAFIAVGVPSRGPTTVLVSTNHAEWKQALVTMTNFSSVTYYKDAYHNGWYPSANPMFWTNAMPNRGFSNVVSIAAIGTNLVRNVSSYIHVSNNGLAWTRDNHVPQRPYRITTISNRFQLVGGTSIFFENRENPFQNRFTPMHLLAHHEDNRTFFRRIASDTNGYLATDVNGANYYSPDAQSWRRYLPGDPVVNADDIAFASPPFARPNASSGVEISDDGAQWQTISAPANIRAAAAISNVIVAADWSNIWVKPLDGAWTKAATKFGRPQIFSEGGSAEILPYDPWINSFTAGKGMIVGATGWGELLFTTNGYDWSTNQTVFHSVNDVTFTPTGLLAQSFYLIAEARFDAERPATNPPRLEITTNTLSLHIPLRYHEIQRSPDLTNWTFWRFATTNSTLPLPTTTTEFYRAVQPE